MNLGVLDWLIVAMALMAVGGVAVVTRGYTRSVADFLAGNRCAGRYLLTMSEGLASLGMVGMLANFEQFYRAGFAAFWWNSVLLPVGVIIALSGWVSYRYRETRALTMAQFFEMRYSRRFRVAAGVTAWISGVLNYGVFPGIVARTIVYFCGLPPALQLGSWSLPTEVPVMALMLGLTLVLTLSGGMVTVMITDFIQAQFVNLVFLILALVLLTRFSWTDIIQTLEAAPARHSKLDPFDQGGISDFNGWFFGIFAFKLVYNKLGWQGTQGYNSAAKSPHEARMAGILAEWRGGVTFLMMIIMPVCAYVLLHHAGHAAEATAVNATLEGLPDAQLRTQLTTPMVLLRLLPAGLLGLLCAAMIAGTVGTDTTYLHAWGSIFVQDVLLPFRRTPLTPRQHLRWLRCSVVGVAVFAFVYSLVFPLRDYLWMYFLITGAIYLSGSGAVIIGGLYWRKGTTAGAWAALLTGASLALLGAWARAIWPSIPALASRSAEFPINGAWMALIASLVALAVYVTVSLLTSREDFDLDRLLHRGAHANEHESAGTALAGSAAGVGAAKSGGAAPLSRWQRRLGINAEFTRGDRFIYFLKLGWAAFWFLAFVIGTIAALSGKLPADFWPKWWSFVVALMFVVGGVSVVWFLWGGIRDLIALVRTLRAKERDQFDDGTVRPKQAPPDSQTFPK